MRPYVLVALAGCLALSCSKEEQPAKTSYDPAYPRSSAYQRNVDEEEMQPASGVVIEREYVVEEQAPSDPLAEPMPYGESVSDQRTTDRIRQALERDTTLSNEAKNVKVVTLNQKVTLRGPVLSMTESQRVEAIAKTVAGAENVENQLEIK